MTTRRSFIKHAATAAVTGAMAASFAGAVAGERPATQLARRARVAGRSVRIKKVVRREETTLRLGGHGGADCLTWAADDRQFVAVCEGGAGWPGIPNDRWFQSELVVASGDPPDI